MLFLKPRTAFSRGQNPPDTEGNTSDIFKTVFSPLLCKKCLGGFKPVIPPLCTRCGVPFESGGNTGHVCGSCIKNPPSFDMARAAGRYEGVLNLLIQRFKYKGKTGLSEPLSMLLFACLKNHWLPDTINMIAPVPLHARRMRKRGFNQAALLLNHLSAARVEDLFGGQVRIMRDLLQRTRNTMPQTGLARDQRKKNIKKAFCLKPGIDVQGKQIVIVDDVMTTGATVSECAVTLLNAGAKGVDVLTLARAG